MNTTDLKIFAMKYTRDHKELQNDEKISVMEFIKEASEDQVLYLLQTGEVCHEDVEVDDKFRSFMSKKLKG
jgi:hypothetical protein